MKKLLPYAGSIPCSVVKCNSDTRKEENRMGKELKTVSSIFMLISGCTALFLCFMGLYPFALLMILFFMLFFLVFVFGTRQQSTGWQKVPEKQKKSLLRSNVRYMRYCTACGFLGSQKPNDAVPACPVCGHRLLSTDVPLKEFSSMTEEQRETIKKTWSYLD